MSWSRALLCVAAIAAVTALALRALGGAHAGGSAAAALRPHARVPARVVRVVDGDTIVARLRGGDVERVRYIGIDTPETVKPARRCSATGTVRAGRTSGWSTAGA